MFEHVTSIDRARLLCADDAASDVAANLTAGAGMVQAAADRSRTAPARSMQGCIFPGGRTKQERLPAGDRRGTGRPGRDQPSGHPPGARSVPALGSSEGPNCSTLYALKPCKDSGGGTRVRWELPTPAMKTTAINFLKREGLSGGPIFVRVKP